MQPTFITEYPAEVSPLARCNDKNPFITDRFELFIAGPRSGASWRAYVNGKEIVDGIQGGSTQAWHLSLMPAEKSYEMQFELWFAPERDWYPVKLHYADKNDGYLQMVLTKISSK